MVQRHVMRRDEKTVSFAVKLANSASFQALFRDGMALVEESAGYLDGPGRAESRNLPRMAALAYATESMRLTTRLMQLASWLLLQRAVNDGEMSQQQAAAQKHKVKLTRQEQPTAPETFAQLPQALRDLTLQSLKLQRRVLHLDDLLYGVEPGPVVSIAPSAIEMQLQQVRRAFEAPRPRQG